jgi:hypothetical protein
MHIFWAKNFRNHDQLRDHQILRMQYLIAMNRKKILLCHDYSFMKSNYKLKSVFFLHISTSQVSLCFKFVFKKYSLNMWIFHPFWKFLLSSLICYCSMYNIFPNIHSWIILFVAYTCLCSVYKFTQSIQLKTAGQILLKFNTGEFCGKLSRSFYFHLDQTILTTALYIFFFIIGGVGLSP